MSPNPTPRRIPRISRDWNMTIIIIVRDEEAQENDPVGEFSELKLLPESNSEYCVSTAHTN